MNPDDFTVGPVRHFHMDDQGRLFECPDHEACMRQTAGTAAGSMEVTEVDYDLGIITVRAKS